MSEQLKECPFCGAKANCRPTTPDRNNWIVECNNVSCGVESTTANYSAREAALKCWNHRPGPSGHADTKAIREVLDEKQRSMMQAHLDGIYCFSARANCDEQLTEIFRFALSRLESSHGVGEDVVGAIESAPKTQLYRVHYKNHNGETWSVIVMASSEQKAEELVSKEDDCRRVVCVDSNGLLLKASIAAYEESENGK